MKLQFGIFRDAAGTMYEELPGDGRIRPRIIAFSRPHIDCLEIVGSPAA